MTNMESDLLAVLEAAQEASLPLTWIGLSEQTPEQVKAFLTQAVDCTVEDGVFTGEMHGIAEAETDRVVAITGCGPKGAANAKHLIWCAHFVHKHKTALATLAQLQAERDALAQKWRDDADEHEAIRCTGLASIKRDCADQLDAARQPQEKDHD